MPLKEQGIQHTNASEAQPVKAAGKTVLRFYQEDRMVTEKGPQGDRRILWTNESAAAQLDGVNDTKLLQTDLPGSILGMGLQQIAYSPYGHRAINTTAALLGFNGQYSESIISGYLLGNGRRMYRPTLMRFCSADFLSPFGAGGVNAYCYCEGDAVNNTDPTGHTLRPLHRNLMKQSNKLVKINQTIQHKIDYLDKIDKIYQVGVTREDYQLEAYGKASPKLTKLLDKMTEDSRQTTSYINKLIEKRKKIEVKYTAAKHAIFDAAELFSPSAPRESIISLYEPSAPRGSIVSIQSSYAPSAPPLSQIMDDVRTRQRMHNPTR